MIIEKKTGCAKGVYLLLRKVSILIASVLLLVSVAACNRRQSAGPESESEKESREMHSLTQAQDSVPTRPAAPEYSEESLSPEASAALPSEPSPAAAPSSEASEAVESPASSSAASASSAPATSAAAAQGELSSEEMELALLRLINREREDNGVFPLGLEDSMQWAARMRAPEVMVSLSHTRTDGTPYYTAFEEAGFVYAGKWHGENVASMYFPAGTCTAEEAAEKMFESLKSSSGHYQNMLSANFAQVGIGIFVQQEGDTVYISSAQVFSSL